MATISVEPVQGPGQQARIRQVRRSRWQLTTVTRYSSAPAQPDFQANGCRATIAEGWGLMSTRSPVRWLRHAERSVPAPGLITEQNVPSGNTFDPVKAVTATHIEGLCSRETGAFESDPGINLSTRRTP
jgi:hypothetical protein